MIHCLHYLLEIINSQSHPNIISCITKKFYGLTQFLIIFFNIVFHNSHQTKNSTIF